MVGAAGVDSDFIQGIFWDTDFWQFLAATLSDGDHHVYRASPRPSSQPLLHPQQPQLHQLQQLLLQVSLYEQQKQQEQQLLAKAMQQRAHELRRTPQTLQAEAMQPQQVSLYEQRQQEEQKAMVMEERKAMVMEERKAMVMQELMSIVESFNFSSKNSRERRGDSGERHDRQRETRTTRSLSPTQGRATHTHTPNLPRSNSPNLSSNFDIHHNPFRAHQHSKGVVNQDPRIYTASHSGHAPKSGRRI